MPLSPVIRELERVSILCPIGIEFRDSVTGLVVSDGLHVIAYPEGQRRRTGLHRTAVATRSGIFAFHELPGMRSAMNGAGDEVFWASPPVQRTFIVVVTDLRRQFLPVRLSVTAPTKGIITMPLPESPLRDSVRGVPLFSAPARSLGGGVAMVRADMWDIVRDEPASWALVEVRARSGAAEIAALGTSDENGTVLVAFGYPELQPPSPFSSPPRGNQSLWNQTWQVGIRVFYGSRVPSNDPPDLSEIFTQPEAELVDAAEPTRALPEFSLSFGPELIVRSSGTGRFPPSVLLVNPAASPP